MKPQPTSDLQSNSLLDSQIYKRQIRTEIKQSSSSTWWPFDLGRLGKLSFFIEIICWASWISHVQNTELPSIFFTAQALIYQFMKSDKFASEFSGLWRAWENILLNILQT